MLSISIGADGISWWSPSQILATNFLLRMESKKREENKKNIKNAL